MGVIVDVVELKSSIPPSRVFKALFLDSNNLMPKILPHIFKSIEYIEGNGGAGSIKLISFHHGDGVHIMKERVDKVDETNHVYNVTIIESDVLVGEEFESVSSENKVEGGGDGGCIIKSTNTYNTKGENQSLIQEKITRSKEGRVVFVEAVLAYLLSNPNEYN